jgi:hypothetical protein
MFHRSRLPAIALFKLRVLGALPVAGASAQFLSTNKEPRPGRHGSSLPMNVLPGMGHHEQNNESIGRGDSGRQLYGGHTITVRLAPEATELTRYPNCRHWRATDCFEPRRRKNNGPLPPSSLRLGGSKQEPLRKRARYCFRGLNQFLCEPLDVV